MYQEDRNTDTNKRPSMTDLSETLEILADPDAMEQLRESIADIEAGRVRDLREVGKELGLE